MVVVGVVSCCRSWRRRRFSAVVVAFTVIVFFAAAAVAATAERPIRRVRPPAATATAAAHVKRLVLTRISVVDGGSDATRAAVRRRLLIGPGSSPPTCRARCGRCTPCRPVHVAIQPGVGAQWEYYPEVWRCKCGNKLFMP